jgi:hypothetical protein
MPWLLTVVFGCGIFELIPEDPEPSCEHRAWYPDADGDGVGEATAMYVGCSPPSGYVDVVDTDPDTF